MRKTLPLRVFTFVSLGVACSAGVGPADRALDGPWSTGVSTIGLNMAVTLTWTRDHVAGSGSYTVSADGARCGTTTITGASSVTFAAARPGLTDIRGQLSFDGGTPIEFDGTLDESQPSPGFARINGMLTAADGARCPLTLFQGLVP